MTLTPRFYVKPLYKLQNSYQHGASCNLTKILFNECFFSSLITEKGNLQTRPVVKYLKAIFKTDLSHPLSFVFVFSLLSGSRLVLTCPHRCFPVFIFNFTCTCRYQMFT